jgi:hypothetical protein
MTEATKSGAQTAAKPVSLHQQVIDHFLDAVDDEEAVSEAVSSALRATIQGLASPTRANILDAVKTAVKESSNAAN